MAAARMYGAAPILPGAERYERILAREGLAPLDYPDGAGGIKTGCRGSGVLLDAARAFARASAAAERDQRRAILATHSFRKGDRRLYALYAEGYSFKEIGRRTGIGYVSVFRRVKRIHEEHDAKPPEMPLGELFADCDASTVVLLFGLLERALEAPGEVRKLIADARAVPEIRALLQPDEVRDG
jgi:hypothetical protein